MPTCGNCGKHVTTTDVTCPHCGVLLAAYASPQGSGAAGTYEAPPPPPSAEIPSVDMEVKPPSEADVVTDPDMVAEEAISTAPRPLFDTYVTVESIVKAAEGDHEQDVVTISDTQVPTKTVEFDVPDYAKPPANAAPIPTVDEDDPEIPLITHDDVPQRPTTAVRREEDEDPEPEPEPDQASEGWLYGRSAPQVAPRPKQKPKPRPATPQNRAPSGPVGETDQYLRKLHAEAGYTSGDAQISKPVEERRISPLERSRNRRSTATVGEMNQQAASAQSVQTGGTVLYILVLVVLWFSTIVSIMSGSFSIFLIFITVAATWGFGPVRKFFDEIRHT